MAVETPGQDVVHPVSDPLKPNGGLVILKGNLAPEGGVVKIAGHERPYHRGPARIFDCEEDAMSAVTHGEIKAGDGWQVHGGLPLYNVIPGRGEASSPESITTIVSMDSGPAPRGASLMCNCTSKNDDPYMVRAATKQPPSNCHENHRERDGQDAPARRGLIRHPRH